MRFHRRIYHLITIRYFSLRFFTTKAGQKFLHYFRHIFHVYFARLEKEMLIILPVGLFLLLLGNLLQPQSQFEIAKLNVLNKPFDPMPHAILAQQFLATNQFSHAETEAILADNSQLLTRIKTIKKQPGEVQNEVIKIQNVISQYSNYRDAYIQLGILNWKLYRPFDAQKYLDIALNLDPNNEVTRRLLRTVE